MNKVKELRIDSTLWATETESNVNNDMKVHNVRYV